MIAATKPDHTAEFKHEGRTIQVEFWHNLVSSKTKVADATQIISVYVFRDPHYTNPLILATDLELMPEAVFLIYRDRWPVEQPPLVAKQMLGLHRQFVFAPLSCLRLPELALLVGNILTYLAAVLPPVPTGYWDRRPKRTSGRLRRALAKTVFPKDYPFDGRLREKRSVTAHLPKGIAAHRRVKRQKVTEPK